MDGSDRSLIILVLDAEGLTSPIYAAACGAGHRPIVATGLETAALVLGTMTPDVVVVRSTTRERDRDAVVRFAACAPEIPVRLLDPEAALTGATLTDAVERTASPLN